jgi:60 kDa SS-A/Ro ribonucleoprotein
VHFVDGEGHGYFFWIERPCPLVPQLLYIEATVARLNTKRSVMTEQTHEGAPAFGNLSPLQTLRRSLLSCFLWEDGFYDDGKAISDRLTETAAKVDPKALAALAIEARTKFNLRHAPLLLLSTLAKTACGTSVLSDTIPQVVRRADELTELLAVYWRSGRCPISAQMKKGLARAIGKFDAYQLAKYNRDGAIKLRDVLFMVHAKPEGKEQKALFKKLAENELESPDTWEVALSAGKDKKKTFSRLLKENNLGYLALLRNVRNMVDSGIDMKLIEKGLSEAKGFERVLPFRFVAAARACPQIESMIDQALLRKIDELKPLPGKTVVLVDVSGSMDDKLSSKSDMRRIDAAAALGAIVRSDSLRVFSFSNELKEVAPRRGMAGVDAIIGSQGHGGTYLGQAVDILNKNVEYDRLIVITDEQSHDPVKAPKATGYMINVACTKNGVGYGRWVHIDGFSERVLDFIAEYEADR